MDIKTAHPLDPKFRYYYTWYIHTSTHYLGWQNSYTP